MTTRPTTNKWPDYHCAERTLDVDLPWGGITARIWFDGRSNEWDEEKLFKLGETIRRNDHWRSADIREFLDWLATLPAVNAVQVTKASSVRVGVMAYTVSFESEADVRNIVLGPGSSRTPDLAELRKITDRIGRPPTPPEA